MPVLEASSPLSLIMGDLNVGHRELDIRNWKGNVKKAGFLPRERAYFDRFLGDAGTEVTASTARPGAGSAGSTSAAASTARSTGRTPGGPCAATRSTTTPDGASTTTSRRPRSPNASPTTGGPRTLLGHPVERPLPRRRGLHDRRLTRVDPPA